jgi:hypothetical protein
MCGKDSRPPGPNRKDKGGDGDEEEQLLVSDFSGLNIKIKF